MDANVYIIYLLSSDPSTPSSAALTAALGGAYTLLLTNGVIVELRRKTATRHYLAARITQAEVDDLVRDLGIIAESVPDLDEPLPAVGRDRKDDYLFAHAVVGQADYLVSGDIGVQGVGRIGDVRIVSPAEFLQILADAGNTPRQPGDLR